MEIMGDEKINVRISQWIKPGDQWIYLGYPFIIPKDILTYPKDIF
jgi:hypothetical protein